MEDAEAMGRRVFSYGGYGCRIFAGDLDLPLRTIGTETQRGTGNGVFLFGKNRKGCNGYGLCWLFLI